MIIQGPTIPWVARSLRVDSPIPPKTKFPIEFEPSIDTKSALKEIMIESKDPVVGKNVVDLNFPDKALIVIINREGKFIVPRGTTEMRPNDKLLILAKKQLMTEIRGILKGEKSLHSKN